MNSIFITDSCSNSIDCITGVLYHISVDHSWHNTDDVTTNGTRMLIYV